MLDDKDLNAMLEKISSEIDLVSSYITDPHFCKQDQKERNLIRELQTSLVRTESILRTITRKY